jgi:DUF3011 family protein
MLNRKTWLYFSSVVAVICIFAPLSSADTISCSSDDMHRHYCSANTRGGVRLIKQRSDSQCIQGQTWGYDRRGIWVDRGCRADFVTGGGYGSGGYGGGDLQIISCSSDDGHRHSCQINGNGGRVTLTKQRSDASCVEGSTWGYNNREIWVDRGCRADFTVLSGYGNGGYGGGGSQMISCSSDDGHRHSCQINGGRVTLTKQRSDASCVEGRTWGYNDREIWVDRGCRADFAVESRYGHGGYGNGGGDADQFLSCSSDDGHRKYCPADTRGGVQMIKQRSDAECRQGYSWGFDRGGVWVDRGCRADFQIVR